MKISEIGEFGFIERFSKHFIDMVDNNSTGIGDDCAILPLDNENDQVVTTDLLIEDIHFIRSKISPSDLGHKSLAVNLSDIAAMGAKPTASFLSIGIPADMDIEFMDSFMEGYRQLSVKYNVPLLGGDTTRSPEKLIINVCVIGKTDKGKAHKRSEACAGDVICVTGPLGDSAAGLKLILENHQGDDESSRSLMEWHNRPEPAIIEGLWLGRQDGVRAMMDISDGIASDLKHILDRSNVGATVRIEDIPLSSAIKDISFRHKWDAEEFSLAGGEDYRLLLTIEQTQYNSINQEYSHLFPFSLYNIGNITAQDPGKVKWTRSRETVLISKGGFKHFGI